MSVFPHNARHMVLPLVYQHPAHFGFLDYLGLDNLYQCPLCPGDFILSLSLTLVYVFPHLPDRIFHHTTVPKDASPMIVLQALSFTSTHTTTQLQECKCKAVAFRMRHFVYCEDLGERKANHLFSRVLQLFKI